MYLNFYFKGNYNNFLLFYCHHNHFSYLNNYYIFIIMMVQYQL